MAKEQTLSLKLSVNDQGTSVLKNFESHIRKTADSIKHMDSSLRLIKLDSIMNLASRGYNAAKSIYNLPKRTADWADDLMDASKAEASPWMSCGSGSISPNGGVEQEQLALGLRTLSTIWTSRRRDW
jgi:hypothetical protein